MFKRLLAFACLWAVVAPVRPARADGVMISEFQALNLTTLLDEDGDSSDWIELYNAGSAPVDLDGYSLTDDEESPARWRFPRVVLGPGEFLIVFASGKNRRDPSRELHTNFRLTSTGEFLGLLTPGGNLVSALGVEFPEQLVDSTYGLEMQTEDRKLVAEGAPVRYLVPENNDLRLTWTEPDFDDGAWAEGRTGIGYDRKEQSTYQGLIQTDVGDDMEGVRSSLYVRMSFDATAEDLSGFLQLQMRYEDGFIAWLNGVEVARRAAPRTPSSSSRAITRRDEFEAQIPEQIPLIGEGLVREGRNVLAFQLLNDTSRSPDVLLLPEMVSITVTSVNQAELRYFGVPTPGRPNTPGLLGIAPEPVFSRPGSTFVESFTVELSVDPGEGDNATIVFTTDGSEPTAGSTRYTEPIPVDGTSVLKAKTLQPNMLASRTVTHRYVQLVPSITSFSSNLPLFIVSTFRRPINQNVFTPMSIQVIDRGENGRASIVGETHFAGNGGIKVRGSSTAGRDKASYNFEIQDEQGEDKDVRILGFPIESDYILYGAFNFDRAHIRNALIYRLSNDVGRYAVRTRFCELFLNDHRGGDAVSMAHYRGIYTFMEKIKRGPERVPVEELEPHHVTEPEITGGYILKIDRPDPGDRGFSAAGQTIRYVYPKERRIAPAQALWIRTHFNQFGAVLNSPNFADPVEGYAKFIDVDSWIDHHILNVLAKNVDAFRLSGYFFKKRNGRIEMGPIWDFDRSMQSTDGRDDNPRTWDGTGDATRFFQYPWWVRLFRDPEFMRKYRARWNDLRGDPLSTEHVNAVIDEMGAELAEAAVRDAQKWRQISPSPAAFQAQLNTIKGWLASRSTWIDSQFIEPPEFSIPGGLVSAGTTVEIDVPKGEIFYTLNGPDPMAGNAAPAPEAIAYDGPITIRENTRIRARARISARVWSEEIAETYVTELLPLVITELMYNPLRDPDAPFTTTNFEFLEILNIGDETVSLDGVQIAGRLRFEFSGTLGPGEHAVVVKNIEAFEYRYGNDARVLGEYTGILSNRSQQLVLLGPLEEVLNDFTYQDAWYPTTDGDGYSLVIRDPHAPRERWNEMEAWGPSMALLGSPGRRDGSSSGQGLQRAGDIDQDGRLNVSDAVGLLRHLFGGAAVSPCDTEDGNRRLLDMNGDQIVNLADVVTTLNYLFQAGEAPAAGAGCVALAGCPDACVD